MSFINIINVNQTENDLVDEINRKKFFDCLEFFDFDIRDIFKYDKDQYAFHREVFNDTLRKIKFNFNIKILDSLLYLDQDCIDMKEIIGMLDSWSVSLIKKEMKDKYGIKEMQKSIEKFFKR